MTTSSCFPAPGSPVSKWRFMRGDLVAFNAPHSLGTYVVLVTKDVGHNDSYIQGVVVHKNTLNCVGDYETQFSADKFVQFNGQVTLTA